MQIFLVGGAIRDKLLDFPSTEKDWVVVGSSPEEMIELVTVSKIFLYLCIKRQVKSNYFFARKSGRGHKKFLPSVRSAKQVEETRYFY